MVEQVAGGSQAPPAPGRANHVMDVELQLLLEAVLRVYGYDFRDYSHVTLRRRVGERMRAEHVMTVSGLQERILHDTEAFQRFVFAMSSTSNVLFNDPAFLKAFRVDVVPLLRTYSFVRLWFPGCSTGKDVYSMAAVLQEEGLLDRCMIYATDMSELAIARAKEGSFEVASPEEVALRFSETDAKAPLSRCCDVQDRTIRFHESLGAHMIFAQHSLAVDGSLNEFHAIVARNTLPNFNKALQFRVHNLFLQSLTRLGFLCLGANESLHLTPHERIFRRVNETQAIYRRMR